jgi:hypothetical protein
MLKNINQGEFCHICPYLCTEKQDKIGLNTKYKIRFENEVNSMS